MRCNTIFPILLLLSLLASCSTLKHLPEGEQLFGGTDLELRSTLPIENEAQLREELDQLVYPRPNSRLFGQYYGLYIHQRAQAEKGRWMAKRLNKRFGEAPVLMSQLSTSKIEQLMENRLENRGYFSYKIEVNKREKKRTGRLAFHITLESPYRLASYQWYGPLDTLARLLQPQLSKSALQKGSRYDLDAFRTERERLDAFLKARGYFAYSPDYFIFRADTNLGDGTYNLYLSFKSETPPAALRAYRITEVNIYPNYQVQEDSTHASQDTVVYRRLNFIESEESFKPKHLSRYILIRPNEPYSRQRELTTTNRLSSIGNFRFVTLRFDQPDSLTGPPEHMQPLVANLYLSPNSKRRLRYETQFLSKSNNFVGPALKIGYQNRNLFKGGEILNIDANFGFETQFAGGRQTGLNAFELGLKSELSFPRVLSPISLGDNVSYGIARTRILAGVSLINRTQFYQLRSAQAGFGYTWNTNRFMQHELQPVALSFTSLSRTSPAFEDILAGNPFLRQSFDQRFIAGMTYQFTFSELNETKRHRWIAIASLDASGNLFGLLQPAGSRDILGEAYAQYVRIDADLRHHWQLTKERRLVFRGFAGAGFSYGNSNNLPYIKQYFAGGPNSVRAFNIRSLGPGNYRPLDFDVASFFDQAGDIKLEANVEYRFPLFPYFKGAWFVDAGNIWLLRDNPALGGGSFGPDWIQEVGVGAGFGLRIDVEILVLRFDLATPLRKPWLPNGERWTTSFQPGNRDWRRDNLNLVFAIGYPF